jgi:hypothetical protein
MMKNLFFKEVSNAPLIIFRIIFGALMLFGISRFLVKGWVYDLYILPTFHFNYLGFEWVKVLPDNWMYLPFIIMLLASIGILLGFFYRISAILFFLSFTYVELIDKTYYLNHYYFVSLMAFLLVFLPANADLSLDVKRNPTLYQTKTANWTILILQLQLSFVYFFAGIAKINYDWLIEAQPLKIWLQAYRDLPFIGWLFASPIVAYIFSWFGCIYDLTIPFFMFNSRTRKYAYFFVIVFHLVTWTLFPIGVFPWVMIFSTLVFFSAKFHEVILTQIKKSVNWKIQLKSENLNLSKNTIILFLSCYIFFQLIIPFRYLLYPSGLFWQEQGFRFSWRVMLMHKEGHATFYVKDRATKKEIEIKNSNYLTESQIDQMATQPDMILQFAHFLKNKFDDTLLIYGNQKFHLKKPSVHAEVFVSLNGRPHREFIRKHHDLSKIQNNLKHRTWVEQF